MLEYSAQNATYQAYDDASVDCSFITAHGVFTRINGVWTKIRDCYGRFLIEF